MQGVSRDEELDLRVGAGVVRRPGRDGEALADDQGQAYYFNSQTGATQWEKPAGFSDTTVQVLSLAGHRVGDAGAEALARLCQWRISVLGLHTLRLQGNRIGDAGAEALGQCLFSPSCRLAHLHLDGNRIGNRGVEALALRHGRRACGAGTCRLGAETAGGLHRGEGLGGVAGVREALLDERDGEGVLRVDDIGLGRVHCASKSAGSRGVTPAHLQHQFSVQFCAQNCSSKPRMPLNILLSQKALPFDDEKSNF